MIEFVKTYYFEIAAIILGIYLLMKVKKIARKIIGIVFSLVAIARIVMFLY